MKKLIFIPDSFKGSLSSQQVCDLMKQAASLEAPGAQCISIPVADGGEGTVDAFLAAVGGERIEITANGPWGEKTLCAYGKLNQRTAVVEMAAAAGLPMVGEKKNPEKTTTYGAGELIRAALESGAEEIILGLGGSATNDGGCGAAAALGVKFLNEKGEEFVPVGETLKNITAIDCSAAKALLQGKRLRVMCDIDNPLCGPQGAAAVFAPQKGADEEMVARLDAGLHHLAEIALRDAGVDMLHIPGAGAAGGMGGGMAALLGGQLQMGIETVLDVTGFDALLQDADAVFTGEGKLDGQSLRGKVVIGVARRCQKQNKPCFAVVGGVEGEMDGAYSQGVTAVVPICRRPMPLNEAIAHSEENLLAAMRDTLRIFKA
ncbi:MAG: glycerate kinase [Clostridiales bacterium]|nr:glycerate kinase [Clostridiales bacterium]